MGIIVTIEYAAGNVMLQLSGKTEAAKWLPLLPAENGITEKMLLADGKGGVSLVVSEKELTGLLTVLPGDMRPDMQSVGLVEITGYGLRKDTAILTSVYDVFGKAGIDVLALSASDTGLTIAVPEDEGEHSLRILEERFGGCIE
ncbi:MAG: hypothetical protein E7658_07970 [Ruminococcaceae bacterium]|nr:hypothetical protein [Oscillospiraceae bacterium]